MPLPHRSLAIQQVISPSTTTVLAGTASSGRQVVPVAIEDVLVTDRPDGMLGAMTATGTRARLVEAAVRTVERGGVSGLTLEAVAREAGVSKGGLLHHFRSKDALVEAVLRDLLAAFDARVTELVEGEGPGRLARAYVRASFSEDPIPLELGALLLTAVTGDSELAALLAEDSAGWRERLADDGLPPACAALIRQAADAAWLERVLDPDADAELRPLVEQELLRLTEMTP